MNPRRVAILSALVALGAPSLATARPVTRPFDLTAGKEEFVRAWLKDAGTVDPSVATGEHLSSNEVLLTAKKPGRTVLLLQGEASLEAVLLRVAAPDGKPPVVRATEEQRAAARKACPGYKEEVQGDAAAVTVAVSSAACRAALRELFEGDEYSSKRMELVFAPEALSDQLEAIRGALKVAGLASIQVGYSGISAVLKGKATAAQRFELMKVLFANSVGPVLFDDQLEVVEEPKKAEPLLLPVVVDVAPASAPDAGRVIPVERIPKKK